MTIAEPHTATFPTPSPASAGNDAPVTLDPDLATWSGLTIAGIGKRLGELGKGPRQPRTAVRVLDLEQHLEDILGGQIPHAIVALTQLSRQVKWLQNYENFGDLASLDNLERSLGLN